MAGSTRTWRQLLVWLHVLASVSWMSQAVGLVVLLSLSHVSPPGQTKVAAAEMAYAIDQTVLVFSANISAFTGFGLAAVTAWGYFHYWWVASKFVITLVQLHVAIFFLSAAMPGVITAARAGTEGPVLAIAVGAGLMAAALAFQAWLSVAKPWGRTPHGERRRATLSTAPTLLIALFVVVPILDVAFGTLIEDPLPLFSIILLAVALIVRRRGIVRRTGVAAPSGSAVASARRR